MGVLIEKTAAEFISDNTFLDVNEIGQETDTFLIKQGRGNWNDLDYSVPLSGSFEQELSGAVNKVPSSKAVKDYVDSLLVSS